MNLTVILVSSFFPFFHFCHLWLIVELKIFLLNYFLKAKLKQYPFRDSIKLHHETPMMCTLLHFESFSIVMPVFTNKKRPSEWKKAGFGSIWSLCYRVFLSVPELFQPLQTRIKLLFPCYCFWFLDFLLFCCSLSFLYRSQFCHKRNFLHQYSVIT